VTAEELTTTKAPEAVSRWHPSQWQLWSYPTKPSFRNDIQGLRAIAVIYTVFFHFGIARYSTGIDIFICLFPAVWLGADPRTPLRSLFALLITQKRSVLLGFNAQLPDRPPVVRPPGGRTTRGP
jgi:hypothetical protein